MARRAGIRELRQNLSRYVDRVKAGETIEVTEHGRLVAALVPSAAREEPLAELRRRGLTITPASFEFSSLAPVPKRRPGQPPLSEVLAELRAAERY
jgi:prevent-host-death family protein